MISIKNLTFSYSGKRGRLFEKFSLDIDDGGITCLLGKNGEGKSTLLYLIAGLLRPRGGSVTVNGLNSSRRTPELLSDIFLVPEEFLLPPISLERYAKLRAPFYPRFNKELFQHVAEVFSIDTAARLDRLSMGQKKKAFMSFALAAGTRLLLLDEPTNGLDINARSAFRRAVVESMTEERTILISTHQVHDVKQLTDHVILIDDSQLRLNASMSDISAKLRFEVRSAQEMDNDVVYAEPSLQGNHVIARQRTGEEETQVDLELLFNAVVSGKIDFSAL